MLHTLNSQNVICQLYLNEAGKKDVIYIHIYKIAIYVLYIYHIHIRLLLAMRKKILLFMTMWIDLEGIMLRKISQTEKDEYCMISLICEN